MTGELGSIETLKVHIPFRTLSARDHLFVIYYSYRVDRSLAMILILLHIMARL